MFAYLQTPEVDSLYYNFLLNLTDPHEWLEPIDTRKFLLIQIINICNLDPKKTPLWHDLCLYHFGAFVHPNADARLVFQNLVQSTNLIQDHTQFLETHRAIETCINNCDFDNAFLLSLQIPFHYYGPVGYSIRTKIFQKAIEAISADKINLVHAKELLTLYLSNYGYPTTDFQTASKNEVLCKFCEIFLAYIYCTKEFYTFPRFQAGMRSLQFHQLITRLYGSIDEMGVIAENFCTQFIGDKLPRVISNAQLMIWDECEAPIEESYTC